MSTFSELRDIALGCVSRAHSSFQAGVTNLADIAVNNALIYTQRNWDFEWNKGEVSIACSPKGSVLTAVDSNGSPTQVKRIIKAFGTTIPTGHNDKEIPYLSRGSQVKDDSGPGQCVSSVARVIHEGPVVYLTPEPEQSEHTLYFYAVKWLPRLVKPTDTNFLLLYGFDYLMYRTVMELNFFIKEDERFNVTAGMLRDSWQSLINWDTSLVSPTENELEL